MILNPNYLCIFLEFVYNTYMEMNNMEKNICNIPHSHKSLIEAHRLWHQSLDNYFDPEGFKTNVNATIQALRNVTFKLQNEKKNIADFESWYSVWQERMKKDKIMTWLSAARTNIVHKKDLEINSRATVTIFNYELVHKGDIVNLPIFMPKKMILYYLIKEGHIKKEMLGTSLCCGIKRKWKVKEFEEDVLYLLSYAITFLYQLLREAHENGSISILQCDIKDTLHMMEIENNTIPQCMHFNDAMESVFSLDDLANRKMFSEKIKISSEDINKIMRKEKKIIKIFKDKNLDPENPFNPFEYGRIIFKHARIMLKYYGYHDTMLFCQKENLSWEIVKVGFEDRSSKYIFWNNIVSYIVENNIKAIIFISEAWKSTFDIVDTPKKFHPLDQKKKKEVLLMDILTKELEHVSYMADFSRGLFKKIKLKDTKIIKNNNIAQNAGYLFPIYQEWVKQRKL